MVAVPQYRTVGLLLEHADDAISLRASVGRFHDDAVGSVPIEVATPARRDQALQPRVFDLPGRQKSRERVAREVHGMALWARVLRDESCLIEVTDLRAQLGQGTSCLCRRPDVVPEGGLRRGVADSVRAWRARWPIHRGEQDGHAV